MGQVITTQKLLVNKGRPSNVNGFMVCPMAYQNALGRIDTTYEIYSLNGSQLIASILVPSDGAIEVDSQMLDSITRLIVARWNR